MVDLNDLIDPNSGWLLTSARGVSSQGLITGNGQPNGARRAFIFHPPVGEADAVVTEIPPLDVDVSSYGFSINDDGTAVAGRSKDQNGAARSYVYDLLSGITTQVSVDLDNRIVVSINNPGQVVWDDGLFLDPDWGYSTIGGISSCDGNDWSNPEDMNNSGMVTGWASKAGSKPQGVLCMPSSTLMGQFPTLGHWAETGRMQKASTTLVM